MQPCLLCSQFAQRAVAKEKKNDIQLGLTGEKERIEFQSAIAVREHAGIMMNGGLFFPEENDNGSGGEGQFFETGAGYYLFFLNYFVFETYGVLGYGHFENHFPNTVSEYPSTTGKLSGNLIRYSIQPNIGITHKYFDVAASLRFSGLHYYNVRGSLVFDEVDQKQYLEHERNHFLIEPAFTMRAGYDFIKFQVQYGVSWNLTTRDFRQDDSYVIFGIVYKFNPSCGKSNSEKQ